MCPKPIVRGLVLSSIVLATVSAQAQVSIDVSKITCDEYVHDKIPTPDFVSFSAVGSLEARAMLSRWLIAAWLSGYYHAKRDNWIIDLESFRELAAVTRASVGGRRQDGPRPLTPGARSPPGKLGGFFFDR